MRVARISSLLASLVPVACAGEPADPAPTEGNPTDPTKSSEAAPLVDEEPSATPSVKTAANANATPVKGVPAEGEIAEFVAIRHDTTVYRNADGEIVRPQWPVPSG